MKGLSFITLALPIMEATCFQKLASSRAISSNALVGNILWEGSHRLTLVGPHHHGRSLLKSQQLIERSASETYSFDSIGSAILTKAEKVLSPIKHKLAARELPELPEPVVATISKSGEVVRQSWFLSPMFLALVPVYCALVTGTFATMPEWWSMMRIHVTGATAMAAVAFFLFSNISFFVAAAYLLMLFPPRHKAIRVNSGVLPIPTPKKMKLPVPTEKSMLGVWMLASGLISTIFHSVQAYGPRPIAESLCFIDHAIAGSSLFYFWRMCGNPSKKVWALGLTSLAFLCITSPSWIYTWCHSMWHVIVSFAAVLWVRESHKSELGFNDLLASKDVDIPTANLLSTNYGIPQAAGRKRVPPVTEIAKFLITAKVFSAYLNRDHYRP